MIERFSVEFLFIQGIVEARCKAASCRAPVPWKATGELDFVSAAVHDHLLRHRDEFVDVERWLATERIGVVRP